MPRSSTRRARTSTSGTGTGRRPSSRSRASPARPRTGACPSRRPRGSGRKRTGPSAAACLRRPGSRAPARSRRTARRRSRSRRSRTGTRAPSGTSRGPRRTSRALRGARSTRRRGRRARSGSRTCARACPRGASTNPCTATTSRIRNPGTTCRSRARPTASSSSGSLRNASDSFGLPVYAIATRTVSPFFDPLARKIESVEPLCSKTSGAPARGAVASSGAARVDDRLHLERLLQVEHELRDHDVGDERLDRHRAGQRPRVRIDREIQPVRLDVVGGARVVAGRCRGRGRGTRPAKPTKRAARASMRLMMRSGGGGREPATDALPGALPREPIAR
jgi:hypothetical protein